MSYQEKKNIVNILTGIIVLASYCAYAFGTHPAGVLAPEDLKSWATTILIFIGIGIVAAIIVQIVFHILMSIFIAARKKIQDEQCDDKEIEKSIGAEIVEDEMDRLIELKSMRVGFIVSGIGFIAALVSVVLDYSSVVMLNVIFISFCVGSLLEGVAQLYFYRTGIHHG